MLHCPLRPASEGDEARDVQPLSALFIPSASPSAVAAAVTGTSQSPGKAELPILPWQALESPRCSWGCCA